MPDSPKNPTHILRRLSDSSLTLAQLGQDIRGRDVQDAAGEKIGVVHDLLVDEQECRVRFIEVASGGFLGMGTTKLMIPVDAIHSTDRKTVYLLHDRDLLASAPAYDPILTLDHDFLERTATHYGYPVFWNAAYAYPERWHL